MVSRTKSCSRRPAVMDAGDLAPLVTAYAAKLATLRHTPLTVANYADAARHLATWLRQINVALVDVDHEILSRFAQHRCRCGGNRRTAHVSCRYVRRARRFVTFLIERGLVPPLSTPAPAPVDPHVSDYQRWLERHRGICQSTIKRHGQMVMRLVAVLGRDPSIYDASLIRRTILAEARQCSSSHLKTMTTALRGYLRFLGATGICPTGLERAVPLVPQWRLSSLPRYLSADDVERLLASCNLDTAQGVRDRAILMLFARLGLRAGDVLNMQLGDIDWAAGTVRVAGKGRREVRLPLPQDVGDAIIAYIDQARPIASEKRVFLRSCAPYRSFTHSSTMSCVVSTALRRAGIKDPPSKGASLLRHSAATAMLRGGATLQSVGAVLRHRSIDTTAQYAKVDLLMLKQIVQPWPGEGSC